MYTLLHAALLVYNNIFLLFFIQSCIYPCRLVYGCIKIDLSDGQSLTLTLNGFLADNSNTMHYITQVVKIIIDLNLIMHVKVCMHIPRSLYIK